ncbi:MAG: hypothetical protein K6G56_08490 [Clostridiales bacterium]|nr:hypothetical protein [Clostridiales bacterium]
MNANDLYKSFEAVGDDVLLQSENGESIKKAAPTRLAGRLLAAAACLAVAVGLGLGGFAVSAEAKEYKAARVFFEEYDLPTYGLTRSEIKAVYRDITTESFTYAKTGEVLCRSLAENSVPGWELHTELRTKEDLQSAWNALRTGDASLWWGEQYAWELGYREEHIRSESGNADIAEYLGTDIIMEKNGDTVWRVRIDGYYGYELMPVRGGVIATGTAAGPGDCRPVIVRLSEEGEILWRREAYADCPWDTVSAMAELSNGDLAFVGVCEPEDENANSDPNASRKLDVCYARYASSGELIHTSRRFVGTALPRLAAPFGDGCIIGLDNGGILTADADGNILEMAVYSEEGRCYRITGMTEYCGRIYLSCYSYIDCEPEQFGLSGELASVHLGATGEEILAYYEAHPKWYETGEAYCDDVFLASLRENYEAVLLRIDPENELPEEFHSVGGSFGSRLSVNESGELEWYVETITDACFVPMYNSHSVDLRCGVYRFVFDADGSLISSEDTGEISGLIR